MEVLYVGEGKVVKYTGAGDYVAIYIGKNVELKKRLGKTVYVIVIAE